MWTAAWGLQGRAAIWLISIFHLLHLNCFAAKLYENYRKSKIIKLGLFLLFFSRKQLFIIFVIFAVFVQNMS